MIPPRRPRPSVGALLLLALLLPSLAAAKPLWEKKPKPKGLSYGGTVFSTFSPDLRMEGPYEDKFEWRAGLDFRVAYKIARNARFQISAKARYHLRVGDRVEADFFANLGDSWFQFRHGKITVRAGIESMKWGQNTLLSPLNVLNPTDYTMTLGGAGVDDPRIPLPVVRATLNLSPVAIEALWIPIFRPQRAAFYGRDFAAFRPGMLEEALPGMIPSTPVGAVNSQLTAAGDSLVDALVALDPYARDGLQSYLVADLPEEFPWHGDFGARVGYTGRGFDANGYFLWHVVDRPEVILDDAIRRPLLQERLPSAAELTALTNPGAELVSSRFERGITAGADLAVAVGDFVVSAEGGYFSDTVHFRKTLQAFRSPMVRYAVELRYTLASTFVLTVAADHAIVIRPAADMLVERQHTVNALVLAVLRLFRERIQITLGATYNPIWQDLYVHPRLQVTLQDRVKAIFGLQIYEGFRPNPPNTIDGFLSMTGGPLGYFRGNDYAYGMVEVGF